MFDLSNMVFSRSKVLSAKNMVNPIAKQIREELVWMDHPDEEESKYLCWIDQDNHVGYKAYIWLRNNSFTYSMWISKFKQGSHETNTIASGTGKKSLLSCVNKFVKEVAVDAAINRVRKKVIEEDMQEIEKLWKKVVSPPQFQTRLENNN